MKNRINFLYHLAQSAILYLNNLSKARRLQIKGIEVRFETVYNTPRTVIYWEVEGCYWIKIKTYSNGLSGYAKGVSLKSTEKDQTVIIQFKGAFNKAEYHVQIQRYIGLNHHINIRPTNFSTFPNGGYLNFQIPGLPIQTENLKQAKLLNNYSAQQLSNVFSESNMQIHISPSPIEFLTISPYK